jgi:branched-chain amino acid transport system substrate-binding protein
MKLAGLLVFINDIHSLGLKTTQGMYLTDSWYWNESAETRAWSRKFFEKFKRMPSSLQAGDYSAAMQYLAAVKATGTDDADKVLAQMKKVKINDVFAKNGWIRDDGRMIHDMYLMQVKTPEQSKEPWDYYNVVETFKGESAWTTKAETKCAAWK